MPGSLFGRFQPKKWNRIKENTAPYVQNSSLTAFGTLWISISLFNEETATFRFVLPINIFARKRGMIYLFLEYRRTNLAFGLRLKPISRTP